MDKRLLRRLLAQLIEQHPDRILALQEAGTLTAFLQDNLTRAGPVVSKLLADKLPLHEVENIAFGEMAEALGASQFNYLHIVLLTEFPVVHDQWMQDSTLVYNISELLEQTGELLAGLTLADVPLPGSDLYEQTKAAISRTL